MDILLIRSAKVDAEEKIARYINNIIEGFKSDTDCHPEYISINMIHVQETGKPDTYIVSDVKIEVKI